MKKIFFLLLMFFITACLRESLKFSVLVSSKCNLPCWNDIVPGETSQDEALQIIKKFDQENIMVLDQPWEIFDSRILFSISSDSFFFWNAH